MSLSPSAPGAVNAPDSADPQSSPEFSSAEPSLSGDDESLKVREPDKRLGPRKLALLGLVGAVAVLVFARRSPESPVVLEQELLPETQTSREQPLPEFLTQMPDRPERLPAADPDAQDTPLPFASETLAAAPSYQPPTPQEQERQLAEQRRAQLEEEARGSSLFFEAAKPADDPDDDASSLAELGPAALAAPAAAFGADPNGQLRKNSSFLTSAGQGSDYLSSALQPPRSPYEIKAGDVITAALVTGVNSDLPGPIVAHVTGPVYDTVSKRHRLIPPGAKLLARYDSMISWGQERVLLCWHRIVFPDGDSLNLECMPAADRQGQAGLTGDVDEHWDRLLKTAGLSTVLSLGTQAIAGRPGQFESPSLMQSAASNAAQQIDAAGQSIVRRGLLVQPTITVPPGSPVNVIVTKDMVLRPR